MITARNHPINCGFATSEFLRANPKQAIAQRSADLEFDTEYGPLNPEGITPIVVGDANYLRTQTDFSTTSKRIVIGYLPEKFNFVKSTASSNAAVLAPTSDPLLFSYVSDGNAMLTVEFVDGETITKQAAATTSEIQPDTFVSFVPGSLGHHLFNQAKDLPTTAPRPRCIIPFTRLTTRRPTPTSKARRAGPHPWTSAA